MKIIITEDVAVGVHKYGLMPGRIFTLTRKKAPTNGRITLKGVSLHCHEYRILPEAEETKPHQRTARCSSAE